MECSCSPERRWTFRKLKLRTPAHLCGRSLILASTGGDSCFHWMTEIPPRLRLAKQAGYEMDFFDHFIINKVEASYQRETLDYLKIPSRKIREIAAKPNGYFCEQAVFPACHRFPVWFPPETIRYLRSIVPEMPYKRSLETLYRTRKINAKKNT